MLCRRLASLAVDRPESIAKVLVPKLLARWQAGRHSASAVRRTCDQVKRLAVPRRRLARVFPRLGRVGVKQFKIQTMCCRVILLT